MALDSHTAVQQVTPGPRNGCYLDTISRECRESHCYLYCVSSVFVSKVERSRWVFLISCSTWRGHGWEAWFITSETTQSFTEQTLALCCWYKYPGTSFNILSHVNPTMCMICLHCGIRSELKWASTAGRMTVFAILGIIISDPIKASNKIEKHTWLSYTSFTAV